MVRFFTFSLKFILVLTKQIFHFYYSILRTGINSDPLPVAPASTAPPSPCRRSPSHAADIDGNPPMRRHQQCPPPHAAGIYSASLPMPPAFTAPSSLCCWHQRHPPPMLPTLTAVPSPWRRHRQRGADINSAPLPVALDPPVRRHRLRLPPLPYSFLKTLF